MVILKQNCVNMLAASLKIIKAEDKVKNCSKGAMVSCQILYQSSWNVPHRNPYSWIGRNLEINFRVIKLQSNNEEICALTSLEEKRNVMYYLKKIRKKPVQQ